MMPAATARRARTPAGRELVEPAVLMPQWAARLVGFGALALVAALEWQRLLARVGSGRALAWAVVATAAGAAVVAVDRLRGRRRTLALVAVAAGALLAGYLVSGADPRLLRPRHWDALINGVVGGAQLLGTVRLPYDGQDPWPGLALRLLGAELLVVAALLALWPRGRGRGYPFLSLVALMILIASPVIALGGTRSLALGVVLAALTVCFLWLERLPLRPGLGVAALLGLALAGALPLAVVTDRHEPWFDYRSFAEGLGPDDPVQFSWAQDYGPITWPRDGNEILRVQSAAPMYWKARDLDVFDGRAWRVRTKPQAPRHPGDQPWQADLAPGWRKYEKWTSIVRVSIRRMRSPDIIGAGTILDVTDNSRSVRAGAASGTWDTVGDLRRGDSYTMQVHTPKPTPAQLADASAGDDGLVDDDLQVRVPLKPGPVPGVGPGVQRQPRAAEVQFRAWGEDQPAYAAYPAVGRSDFDVARVMRRSLYARTWALAQRLRSGAKSPFDYLQRVSRFLARPEFRYSERPAPPPPGRPPLDAFINDTHEGYCQHFAGAMALLLRMGGVPARVATGFTPGGYSGLHKAWIVRDIDAHAWVEAWFDRFGWVTFDPTPPATPARSQIAAVVLQRAAPGQPTVSGSGPNGLERQVRREDLLGGGQNVPPGGALNRRAASGGTPWWVWSLGGAVALALLAGGVAAVLHVRARRAAGPMERAIAELEAALRRCGRPLKTGTTLRQLEPRLGGSPEVVAYLRALSAGRYAPSPPPAPAGGRRALRRALAAGLGFGGRLRALWALPPRLR
jgi:protein-glutamine gamma-glutamyltransferase